MIATSILCAGLAVIVVAWGIRLQIFYSLKLDPVAATHVEGTFPTTFSDFLWLFLYRDREKINPQLRTRICSYFWLMVTGTALLLLGFLILMVS